MKNKLFYFLLLLFSLVLPIAFLRDAITGIAFFTTLLAVFGAGRAFLSVIFPSRHFDFNSFAVGFVLLSGLAFLTAFLNADAIYFKIIYIAATGYAIFWLLNYFKSGDPVNGINKIAVIIFLLILAFNIYPTLLIQGYAHDNVFSWVNTDATVYTSIANRVKLGIYPITIPGFGIDKLYYHFGSYAFAGFVANIFHLPASGSLYGIIRPLAVCAVLFSIISIANTAANKSKINYRVAGALLGFFFIGSLTAVFEYTSFAFPRIDHGMKHLRGFIIGHSSLWIFASLMPVIAIINYKIVHRVKFNFLKINIFIGLILFTGTLNFVAGTMCFCMGAFFMLFYNDKQLGNSFIIKRNFAIILLPFLLLITGIVIYLRLSSKDINASLFSLPVFDLGTWSNFLAIFFVLYIGLRIFGLNYLFSKAEIHFGYIQLLIILAALSFMSLLGFFVEGGRVNDIKYGYVIIEGTLGLFSGIWLAERFGNFWDNKHRSFLVDLRKLFYPFAALFSLLLLIALAGYAGHLFAPALTTSSLKYVVIFLLLTGALLLLIRFVKKARFNKVIFLAGFGILAVLSLPGILHEFNKYRTIKKNDEAVQLNAAELKLADQINKINNKHELVLVGRQDDESPEFSSDYRFSSVIDAPLLNEGSKYFGVGDKPAYHKIETMLDSLYINKNISSLGKMADSLDISFFIFNTRLLDSSAFKNSAGFKLRGSSADSLYIVEYLQK